MHSASTIWSQIIICETLTAEPNVIITDIFTNTPIIQFVQDMTNSPPKVIVVGVELIRFKIDPLQLEKSGDG